MGARTLHHFLVVSVVLLMMGISAVQGAACEHPWEFLNGTCYLFDKHERRWDDARTFCQARGGNVASFIPLNISGTIRERMLQNGVHSWWTGFRKRAVSSWHWIFGGHSSTVNTSRGTCSVVNIDGHHNDTDCYEARPVICEKKPAESTETTPLAESQKTSILRSLRKSVVTEETVVRTKDLLLQPGETLAADVVEVAEILQRASQLQDLSAQTATDVLEIVDSVAGLNRSVLHESNSVGNTTNRLIEAVEELADKVSLEEGPVRLQTNSTNSTVLLVWNLTTAFPAPFFGLRLNSDGEAEDVRTSSQSDSDTFADTTYTAVMLPGEIGRSVVEDNSGGSVRLSASVIKQTGLFRAGEHRDTTHTDTDTDTSEEGQQSTERGTEGRPTAGISLNSRVLSLRITVDGEPVTDLSALGHGHVVTTVFQPLEPLPQKFARKENDTRCVFWDFALRGYQGGWSTQGCHLESFVSGTVTCVCNHLTSFAVLMDLYGDEVKIPAVHEHILGYISTVGLALSICGLFLTIIAFILVKKLQESLPQQTLFNMALAMLLSWVTFLAGIRRVEDHVTCVAVAMLLHYFILVTFLWMLAQGLMHYVMLVKARARPFTRYMLKAGLPAWGLPVLPVIAVSAVDVELYRGREEYCWMSLTAFYYAFLAPIAIISAINIVIYVLVVVNICRRPRMKSGAASYTAIGVRASFSCFVALGLSWTFAFFALGDARLVFQYLFAITTALQGFLIFVLYTARDPDVRAFFLNTFRKEDGSPVPEPGRYSGRRLVVETATTKDASSTHSK
ncbi:adhesion G-protein coupled receptor G6-like [Babylonia areolata]|uniref:adhesion G-protein coupled receptor G6-like n=1 Tax=Babylonia areolata TaxID=304850 RepID=UPI003FD30B97